jgi:DNA-binding transcriptional MocR family regulator
MDRISNHSLFVWSLAVKTWVPRLPRKGGPTYLALANEIAAAIEKGELRAGSRLPPQRELAELLKIDVTTVSRAMTVAQQRGLVIARGRAGSYVATPRRVVAPPRSTIDLAVNYPPPLSDESQDVVREAMRDAARSAEPEDLLEYPRRGWEKHGERALPWFEMLRLSTDASHIAVAGGAQQALIGINAVLCEPGDAIIAPGLTYPGMMTIARRMGLRVFGVEMDEQGIIPSSLAEVSGRVHARYVYVVPTFDNPTTATARDRRRAELADVIERANLLLVEDDGHAALLEKPIAPVSSHIPQRSYYVSGMSKAVSPGLRTAYVVTPSVTDAYRVSSALVSLGQFPAPIAVEATSRLIESGAVSELNRDLRSIANRRWEIARRILPELQAGIAETNYFGWLSLPNRWRADGFMERCRELGVQLSASSAFAVNSKFVTNGLRVCLGAPTAVNDMEAALEIIASVMREDPSVMRPPY